MQAIDRVFRMWSQGFVQVWSLQLAIILVLIYAIVRYLMKQGDGISNARFTGLSVLAGLLGVFALGAAFHTPTVSDLLGIKVGAINEQSLSWVKGLIALAAASLSVYEGVLIAQKKAPRKIWVKGVALALAAMSIGAYFRYGDFGYQNFYHRHEFFHYYLGSKYDRELGYERLYQCVAVAQADSGQTNEVKARKMMDLKTDFISPTTEALAHPEECKSRFTPENWEAFKADVKFFRNSANLQYWNDMQKDHGYNPPPVWSVMGHFWGKVHPATDHYLKFLASFDIALFAGLFAAIYWAFGWRVFSVAAIFWGCQLPAEYFWTGGAFLRQDWLFFLVLSACLLRKRYFAWGGASFAYSTLLRVFPGLLLAGLFVAFVGHIVRKWKRNRASYPEGGLGAIVGTLVKSIAPHHLRVAAGGLVATVALVGMSAGIAGWRAYPEFYHHIQVHNHTPLTNNMGLPTILAHSYAGRMEFVRNEKHVDAFDDWKQMRTDRLKAFRPLQLVLLLGVGILFVKVVGRMKSLWMALALSLVVFVGVLEVTCYYYSIFILAAVLSRHRRDIEQWILCVAGISQLLAVNHYISYYYDDRYTAQSVLFCLFAVTLLVAYLPAQKKSVKAPEGAAAPKPETPALSGAGETGSTPAEKPAA
jgi:hypothetical protein